MSAIDDKYRELEARNSSFGTAISEEINTPDGLGRYRQYEGGFICWSAETGAHEIHGAIQEKWQELQAFNGILKIPINDESDVGDGVGRFNDFIVGSIYWSPTTGAHEVHGDIRAHWIASGGPLGDLGYPVTDELQVYPSPVVGVSYLYQFFQYGSLRWTAEHGVERGCWPQRLFGIADTHCHPAAQLGFGGLMHGAVEGEPKVALGSCEPTHGDRGIGPQLGDYPRLAGLAGQLSILIPSLLINPLSAIPLLSAAADTTLRRAVLIAGLEESFGHRTFGHGGGNDDERHFDGWPSWRSRLHQQMHLSWIRRAYEHGHRLLVSLAVGSEVLSAVAGHPQQDMALALKQTDYITRLATANMDWMAIARTPDEARGIIASNRLAIILGIEVDFLGEFHVGQSPTQQQIASTVQTLFDAGIRYVFPIHLTDNAFGGMAIYERFFTIASTVANLAAPLTDSDPTVGDVNRVGLTTSGVQLLDELMARGMLIDIDHMSLKATDNALSHAEQTQYPLVSGHATFADLAPTHPVDEHSHSCHNESRKTRRTVERLQQLGSFIGVQPVPLETLDVPGYEGRFGEFISPGASTTFTRAYLYAKGIMNGRVAIGTDLNGLAGTSDPRFGPGAAFQLRDDPLRRRKVANHQGNGVRYKEPLNNVCETRFDPQGASHYLDDEERMMWRCVMAAESGSVAVISSDIFNQRPAATLLGLRASSRPDNRDELVAWLAKTNGNLGELNPDERTRAQKLRGVLECWTATKGPNPPLSRCKTGTHDFDYNLEGLAHYGMLPDFFADVSNHGLAWDDELLPMLRSAETIISTWEKCTGQRARGPESPINDVPTIIGRRHDRHSIGGASVDAQSYSTCTFLNLFGVGTDGRIWGTLWTGTSWNNWEPIGNGVFAQNTPISVISIATGTLNLFGVGTDGRIWDTLWTGTSWNNWEPIVNGVFAQNTPISVISIATGTLNLFGVGTDGRIWGTLWTGTSWNNWEPIGNGVFAQNTPISVISIATGTLNLFGVGTDGRIWGTLWTGTSWNNWEPIVNGVFAQNTPISVISIATGTLNLFGVGTDGRIWGTLWTGTSWNNWEPIVNGVFAQNTPISVISIATGTLNLFGVGTDGRIWGIFWNSISWSNWFPIGNGIFAQNTPISVVSIATGTMNLFGVGTDGRIWGTFWNDMFWSSWEQVSDGMFVQNTPISVISMTWTDYLLQPDAVHHVNS